MHSAWLYLSEIKWPLGQLKKICLANKTHLIDIFSYGSVIACYLMHKEIYTHVVVYEEMISNIIAGTKTLFEKLDFPSDYVPETLTG